MPNRKFGFLNIIPTMNMQLFMEKIAIKKIFILLQMEVL